MTVRLGAHKRRCDFVVCDSAGLYFVLKPVLTFRSEQRNALYREDSAGYSSENSNDTACTVNPR
ncbi:hypothetical protein WN55_03450 [Dufourea novaeangliae]|uniref:Uncharacterized protein n=1 Tax=Dufourea novaeangliae TaxID=178035 RepID=A0A154PJ80_DUFNO|nr:hypothetical protein WN55_03450 [Dufourea novaeangliae]